jgi:3-oxoacyl-ACP reductase-like protein
MLFRGKNDSGLRAVLSAIICVTFLADVAAFTAPCNVRSEPCPSAPRCRRAGARSAVFDASFTAQVDALAGGRLISPLNHGKSAGARFSCPEARRNGPRLPFLRMSGSETASGTEELDVTGKVCLVTGGNRGMGLSTARGLLSKGAHVVVTCRDQEGEERAARKLKQFRQVAPGESEAGSVAIMRCDLSSLSDVRRFAGELSVKYPSVRACPDSALPGSAQRPRT